MHEHMLNWMTLHQARKIFHLLPIIRLRNTDTPHSTQDSSFSFTTSSMIFTKPIFTEFKNFQRQYAENSYTEFHPHRSRNTERTSINSLQQLPFKPRVSNPRAARLYYAVRSHISTLCIVLYCGRVPAANAPGCTAAEGLLYKPWSLVVPTCPARCLHQRPY